MAFWIKKQVSNTLWFMTFWAVVIAFVSGLYLWDKVFPSNPMSPEEERDYYNGVPADKNTRWGQ